MHHLPRSSVSRWLHGPPRGVERLRQALRDLQRLLAIDRPPEALALIPIRSGRPPDSCQAHERNGHDSRFRRARTDY
jgi:hypothetical protein